MRLIFALLFLVSLTSCSITADVYPVAGPLSVQVPLPVLKARVNGVTSNSGTITLKMPDGELCKGRWSSVAPRTAGYISGNVGLASVSGSYVGIKPGMNRGEAFLAGDRGTTMTVVFYTGSGTANGYGTAQDNKGNFYKVLF